MRVRVEVCVSDIKGGWWRLIRAGQIGLDECEGSGVKFPNYRNRIESRTKTNVRWIDGMEWNGWADQLLFLLLGNPKQSNHNPCMDFFHARLVSCVLKCCMSHVVPV